MPSPDWIAAELTFDELRLWLMRGTDVIRVEVLADVTAEALPKVLSSQPDVPIYMADLTGAFGSDSHAAVPHRAQLHARLINLDGRQIHLAQGSKQTKPAAVMHGQSASIAGILAAVPQFDGVILNVGAHSYWVRISAGEICHFQGYLTGDLLKHIGGAEYRDDIAGSPEFFAALDEAISRPQRAYGHLLNLHGTASPQLAGSLIGLELADAKTYWLGETIMIIGPAALTRLYSAALQRQGVTTHEADRDAALLAGLRTVHQQAKATIH